MTENTADRLYDAFYTAKNGRICLKGNHPAHDTARKMVFEANDQGLGWDWSYKAVQEVLGSLSNLSLTNPEDIRESAHEVADGLVDIYNHDRIKWLAEDLNHAALCDEAVGDLGGKYTDLFTILGYGQYQGYLYAIEAVANNWPDIPSIEETDICDECGEEFPESQLSDRTGDLLCPECTDDYNSRPTASTPDTRNAGGERLYFGE